MKIVATSDLHGNTMEIPKCDVLIVAGDILPLKDETGYKAKDWLHKHFRWWLEYVSADHIIGIAGNHDFAFQSHIDDIHEMNLPWIYLEDNGVEIDGVSFWGLPWIPHLQGWAFYGNRETLKEKYSLVPKGTDIVISHGPPFKHLDNNYGASQCNDMLKRVKPKIFICGHVHEGYGRELGYKGTTDLYNVSHCDIFYNAVNAPQSISVPQH